jgi:hypothetical protein
MFTMSILRLGKKENNYLQKNKIRYFQILACALEKYNYISLAFETNANNC